MRNWCELCCKLYNAPITDLKTRYSFANLSRIQLESALITAFQTLALAWHLSLVAALLLVPAHSRASDSDFQLWPVGRVHQAVNEDWSISFMARGRFDEDASHSKDYLLRPYVSWTIVDDVPFIDSLTVMAGYDYLYSFDGRDEHRAWQSAHHAVEHERLRLVHRVRFDERFIEGVDPTIVRFRYRMSTSHPFGDSAWYGFASEEIFANLNDGGEGPVDGFEQNRLRLGIGRYVFPRLRVEGGYEFQFARRRANPDEFRHVLFLEFSLSTGHRRGNVFIAAPSPVEASDIEDDSRE
jgi:hypothetical protein